MANKSLNRALQQIRRLAAVQTARELADNELLQRFIGEKDEAAFAVLVERHGGMILGVCRRALGSAHDAEDACQTTFLVLAQKARSIRKTTSLPSWLHAVASRVAANLKRERNRPDFFLRTAANFFTVGGARGNQPTDQVIDLVGCERGHGRNFPKVDTSPCPSIDSRWLRHQRVLLRNLKRV